MKSISQNSSRDKDLHATITHDESRSEEGGSEDILLTNSRRTSFTRVRIQPVGSEMLTQPLLKPTVYSMDALVIACRDQLQPGQLGHLGKMKGNQSHQRWLRLKCEMAIRRALKMVPPPPHHHHHHLLLFPSALSLSTSSLPPSPPHF